MFNSGMNLVITICLAGLVSCGCSSEGGTRPPMGKVKGTVTHKGKPVPGVSVNFVKEGAPRGASGITDSNGVYKLTTFDSNDGAVLGTHKVFLAEIEAAAPGQSGEEMTPESLGKIVGDGKFDTFNKKSQKAGAIPAKYTDPKATPLKFTVDPGENEKNIEIED